ncbi:MAG TPA: twin-arginine translocase subunit TatC [Pirellulaceae bacterium]|nr:twin-arginine translocase subunit TatC [Pirellulaceae bacterium]
MAKQTHEDLFEGTTMTFGEHLEELRVYLFRALAGVAIGCIIGFFLANRVVEFFQAPLKRTMESYLLRKAEEKVAQEFKVKTQNPDAKIPLEMQQMIRQHQLVPEPLEIETGRLITMLKEHFPSILGALDVSPHLFVPDDMLAGGEGDLARAIVVGKTKVDASPASRIWAILSEAQRTTIAALAKKTEPPSIEDRRQLLAILNDLAGKRELHDSPEFKPLLGVEKATTDDIRASLARRFDEEQSRRLNRMLLAGLFPQSIRVPQAGRLQIYAWKPMDFKFQNLNVQEPFMIWMKAGIMTGLVIASPWIFIQIWNFVAAGLYPHEKNYVYLYMPVSLGLFFGGAALAYLFVFDPVLNFLFLFNESMNAEFIPRLGEWLSFVLFLPVGFGIAFQLPLVMLFLNRAGLVSLDLYVKQWRIAILSIFVIAMVLTPADPYSMMLMAIPLCLLYVIGIAMCLWMPRGRNPFAEAYEV